MKYNLLTSTTSGETKIFDTEIIPDEKNDLGVVVVESYMKETPTNRFFVSINLKIEVNLGLPAEHGVANPVIEKSIIVESKNTDSRNAIEAKRQKAIDDFMTALNNS